MKKHLRHDRHRDGSAMPPSFDAPLPECLADLVDAEVWARSNERTAQKLLDAQTREVRERLYIETLADHLMNEVEDAPDGPLEDTPEEPSRRAA